MLPLMRVPAESWSRVSRGHGVQTGVHSAWCADWCAFCMVCRLVCILHGVQTGVQTAWDAGWCGDCVVWIFVVCRLYDVLIA